MDPNKAFKNRNLGNLSIEATSAVCWDCGNIVNNYIIYHNEERGTQTPYCPSCYFEMMAKKAD